MNQSWENKEKPKFKSNFGMFGPNLDPQKFVSPVLPPLDFRHGHKLSSYSILRKIYGPNSRK